MFNLHLPTVEIIAGDTCPFIFDLRDITHSDIFTHSCTAYLSIAPYVNDGGDAVVTKELLSQTLTHEDDLIFELEPSETIGLRGKYVYQLLLRNDKRTEIFEGHLIVYANRNKTSILS